MSEAQPLKIQADLMREEMLSAEAMEYTVESLPLLLLQVSTVKILKFGTPQTIAIIVLKIEKFDVTFH